MILKNLDISSLKSLFAFLDTICSSVFWMRSPDYKEQIYVSRAYEKIWLRSCESLYAHPTSWDETLIPDDQLLTSYKQRCQNNYTGTTFFKIADAHGKIRYIKDQSHVLLDRNEEAIAVVGVGEWVNEEYWHELIRKKKNWQLDPHFSYFLNILKDNFSLQESNTINEENTLLKKKEKHYVQIQGNKIVITAREYQILEFLKKGYLAKCTASELNISVRTVETHLDNLRKKTKCRTKLELVAQTQFVI